MAAVVRGVRDIMGVAAASPRAACTGAADAYDANQNQRGLPVPHADCTAQPANQSEVQGEMMTEPERTDPNDWSDMWAWMDGEWKLVRKTWEQLAEQPIYFVEEYEHPGMFYMVKVSDCRRGEKPTEPPERPT